MSDPVTPRLYVLLDASPGRLPSSGDVLSVREASPAEVLAHPAVLALVAENAALVRECDRWRHGEPVEEDYVCPGDLRADEAEKERDRLRDVLAAERGERGPEGWRWEDFGSGGEWLYPTPTGAGSLVVRRSMSVRRWVLELWHDGEFLSAHDYALEAMEAARAPDAGGEGT